MQAQARNLPAPPFSLALFGYLAGAWQDWKRGIPPGRRWVGRGAQNPNVLRAFAVLDRAEADVQRAGAGGGGPAESTAAFEARIRRECGSG
jgi:hypothetical protein